MPRISPQKINYWMLFKLPAAFICGVRVRQLNSQLCVTSVTYGWINQNPFRSMYFAVQAMAAELSTGAQLMFHISESTRDFSMLVISNKSDFKKKATGRITFSCTDGPLVADAVLLAITTGEKQTLLLKSTGTDAADDIVCEMAFEWSIKLRK